MPLKAIHGYLKTFTAPKVLLDAKIDHMEIAGEYLVLGLNLTWKNETPQDIPLHDIDVVLFPNGLKNEGVTFLAYEHFTRDPGQRVIEKVTGSKEIQLKAKSVHHEFMRFRSHTLLDLPPGKYQATIHCSVAEGDYVHPATLEITSRDRYRMSEEWA